jgi:hypothetical protein
MIWLFFFFFGASWGIENVLYIVNPMLTIVNTRVVYCETIAAQQHEKKKIITTELVLFFFFAIVWKVNC